MCHKNISGSDADLSLSPLWFNYALVYLYYYYFLHVMMQSDALKIKQELKDAKMWTEVSKWLTHKVTGMTSCPTLEEIHPNMFMNQNRFLIE